MNDVCPISLEPMLKSCLSTNNLSDMAKKGGMDRSVSFNKIIIREYAPSLGDNPSVSNGPPISIDWDYNEQFTIDVEQYERHRTPRREKNNMKLPAHVRRNILKNDGFSMSEIEQATKDAFSLKKKRLVSNNATKTMEKTSFMMESIGRKLRRVVSLNSMEKKFQKLMDDARQREELLEKALINHNKAMRHTIQGLDLNSISEIPSVKSVDSEESADEHFSRIASMPNLTQAGLSIGDDISGLKRTTEDTIDTAEDKVDSAEDRVDTTEDAQETKDDTMDTADKTENMIHTNIDVKSTKISAYDHLVKNSWGNGVLDPYISDAITHDMNSSSEDDIGMCIDD